MTDPAPPTGFFRRLIDRVRRHGARWISVYFVALISLPLVLFLAGARPVQKENTTPAPRPNLTFSDVMNTEMYAGITAWFEDRLPGRDRAIEANAWIEYRVFGTSPSPRVLLGADDWLYISDSLKTDCLSLDEIDAVVGEMELIDRALELTGRRFVVLVAPNKASIYPEHLGGLADDTACPDANRAAFVDAISLSGAVESLDTWGILREAKSGGQVYHRLDTHWNRLGTAAVAEDLLESLQPGLWDPTALVFERTSDKTGDLVRLMGLSLSEQAPFWAVSRGGRITANREQLPGRPLTITSHSTVEPSFEASTLMIHDSMGEVVSPHMRPYFEELVTVKARGPRTFGLAGSWFDDLLRSSDVFIAQSVERFLFGRFNGELGRLVIGAVAAELPHYEIPLARRLTGDGTDTRWSVGRAQVITDGPNPTLRFGLPEAASPGQFLVVDITPAEQIHVRMSWSPDAESFSEEDTVRVKVGASDTTAVFDLSVIGDATEIRLDLGRGPDHRVSAIRIVDLGSD